MESTSISIKIVYAAQRLFAERGYSGASVDDVASEAGCTKGAVYHSFKNKRELFRAACVATLDKIIEHVEDTTTETDEHTVDEIVTGGDRLFDAYEDPRVRRLLLIDGPSVLGINEWNMIQERLRVELGEHALHHVADAGLIDRSLVPMMAHLLFGAFSQGVLQIMVAQNSQDASRLARAAYYKLAKGLLAAE